MVGNRLQFFIQASGHVRRHGAGLAHGLRELFARDAHFFDQ